MVVSKGSQGEPQVPSKETRCSGNRPAHRPFRREEQRDAEAQLREQADARLGGQAVGRARGLGEGLGVRVGVGGLGFGVWGLGGLGVGGWGLGVFGGFGGWGSCEVQSSSRPWLLFGRADAHLGISPARDQTSFQVSKHEMGMSKQGYSKHGTFPYRKPQKGHPPTKQTFQFVISNPGGSTSLSGACKSESASASDSSRIGRQLLCREPRLRGEGLGCDSTPCFSVSLWWPTFWYSMYNHV